MYGVLPFVDFKNLRPLRWLSLNLVPNMVMIWHGVWVPVSGSRRPLHFACTGGRVAIALPDGVTIVPLLSSFPVSFTVNTRRTITARPPFRFWCVLS
jgi:hypothetical protein